MKIALFSDVHRRLRIVLHMIQCWQIQHKTYLDAVLMAGDLGCLPDESRFDKATRKWVERDPWEAGFSRYFMRPEAELEAAFRGILERGEFSAVKCLLLFVVGNHEHHAYLHKRRKSGPALGMPLHTFPVDCYRRVHCLDDGCIVSLDGTDGSCIRVAGPWGVENSPAGSPKAISQEANDRLVHTGTGSFDLLLTHDAPGHSYTGHAASTAISKVLRAVEPPLHLFGHAHPVDGQHEFVAEPIPTRSWIIEDVGFGPRCYGTMRGCMGILHWAGPVCVAPYRVAIVQDEWLGRMPYRSWQHVWPELDGTS